jgi:predicted PurR-regulated permease PerM
MLKTFEHTNLKVLYILLLTAAVFYLVSPFAASIIFGGTIALAMFPLLQKLEKRGFSRQRSALILTTIFAFLISVPFLFFVAKGTVAVTDQLEKFNQDVQYQNNGVSSVLAKAKDDLVKGARKFAHRFGADTYITDDRADAYLVTANNYLLAGFQATVAALPNYFLYFLIMVLCTYSFLCQAMSIRRFFQNLFALSDERMDVFVNILITDSRGVYVTNIMTAAIQSLCVAVGVFVLGIGDFFLTFFVTLILAFIPIIGAAPVAFVYALVAVFQENTFAAIAISVIGVFSGLIDNILRPWLASIGESKIPALVAFICVVGGALLFGFPGLFVGLLLGSFAYDTIPFFWEELNREKNPVSDIILPDAIAPARPPVGLDSARH